MKYSLIILLAFAGIRCTEELVAPKTLCRKCNIEVQLNNEVWQSYVYSSSFVVQSWLPDTGFYVGINEEFPEHNFFRDVLSMYNIPYDIGKTVFDSTCVDNSCVGIQFRVFEVDRDVSAQSYRLVQDGHSYIDVTFLNKATREFELSFYFKMVANHPDWHFLWYPPDLIFEGYAKGQLVL